jgi:phosphatidate cytidylyltransferase
MAVTVPSPADIPDVGGEVASPPRAGRNLPAAIAVGLALGAVILTTLFTRRATFVGVIIAAISVGTWEVSRALRELGARVTVTPLLVGGAVTIAASYLRGSEALLIGLAATVLACLVWRLADGAPGYLRDFTASAFVAMYVPFLAGFAAMLTAPTDGPRRVVAFIATVVCSDVGGYAAGALFGKHPMAPSVSPKKSWEGFAGSTLACATAGVVFFMTLFHHAWWQGAIYGVAVVLAASLGDLGESLVKRDIGIKDMGHILPGHGGLMDRLDSLLITAPVSWLLLTGFVPHP